MTDKKLSEKTPKELERMIHENYDALYDHSIACLAIDELVRRANILRDILLKPNPKRSNKI